MHAVGRRVSGSVRFGSPCIVVSATGRASGFRTPARLLNVDLPGGPTCLARGARCSEKPGDRSDNLTAASSQHRIMAAPSEPESCFDVTCPSRHQASLIGDPVNWIGTPWASVPGKVGQGNRVTSMRRLGAVSSPAANFPRSGGPVRHGFQILRGTHLPTYGQADLFVGVNQPTR